MGSLNRGRIRPLTCTSERSLRGGAACGVSPGWGIYLFTVKSPFEYEIEEPLMKTSCWLAAKL